METSIKILKCQHCQALAVSVNDIRLTSHKCAGAWDIVLDEPVDVKDIRAAIKGRQS